MDINLAQLTPYHWILAVIQAVVLAFVLIRFFWQHILKYIVHGCIGIVGILALLAMLHYIFKIF